MPKKLFEAENQSRTFQLDLPLPLSLEQAPVESGPSFNDLCDEAAEFLGSRGFIVIGKLIRDGREAGLSSEMISRYQLACRINDQVVVYRREGWQVLSPEPKQNE